MPDCSKLWLAFLLPLVFAAPAHAVDARIKSQLKKLTPDERLEQRCDIEAMNRIAAAKKGFRPDKVIAYSFGDPTITGNSLKTKGAVFRSRGEWYHLAYRCDATRDRLNVKGFKFRIGDKVPREDWEEYYLYD